MAGKLSSYAEAAEHVRRYIFRRAEGGKSEGVVGTSAGPVERVALREALGRVLAEGIWADRDQPPFARATRDGFACRATDASTNQLLFLSGAVRAGEASDGVLGPGEVWEIMTGAAVPEGADAVFMVEHAEVESGWVKLGAPRRIEVGENVVARGAEARAGDLLVAAGVRVGPAQVALAAQCGYAELVVGKRPRVAILATGDELVAIEGVPGPGQIRNSNAPMLAALVTAAGGEPIVLPVAVDSEEAVDGGLARARSVEVGADVLLISGGVSAGKFDLVEGALTRIGARFFFRGVAIQPGKPVVFGELPGRDDSALSGRMGPLPFFGLPGNPISSAVTFHLFAGPLLAAFCNDSQPLPRFGLARLGREWRGKAGLTRFLPAFYDFAGAASVMLVPWQGSGDLVAFARANCFLVVPEMASEMTEGEMVSILLM